MRFRSFIAGLVFLLILQLRSAFILAAAPEDSVLNPQYMAWVKFSPGSSVTTTLSADSADGWIHLELMSTLQSVDETGVTLDLKSERMVAGKRVDLPDRHFKELHWLKASDLTQLPDQDVPWNGMPLHCRVFQITSGIVGDSSKHGTSTVYLNDSIPGGLVKSDIPTVSGKPGVALLKSFETPAAGKLGASTAPATQPMTANFGPYSFNVPIGWKQDFPDQLKTAAVLLLNGRTWYKADGMIKLDVARPAFPSARATAIEMAGKDGRVLPGVVQVDGVEGVKVETPSTDMARPCLAVALFRDQKLYLIMGASAHGTDISAAFDEVVRTWRWNSVNPVNSATTAPADATLGR